MAQEEEDISASSQLKTTLSKLHPIEEWSATRAPHALNPFAPRFCWRFFRPDPEVLRRLGEGIVSYKGAVRWMIGPPEGRTPICLVATEPGRNQFVGYPLASSLGEHLAKMKVEPMASDELIARAMADIPNLCSYLERYLKLEDTPAKSFDPRLVCPPVSPPLEGPLEDFVERGMQVVWIVQQGMGGSVDRQMLHFGVSEDEWHRIRAEALKVSSVDGTPQTERVAFPFLSRIEEYESISFTQREVEPLRAECVRVRMNTSDSLAIRGLDKLILICNWAERVKGEVLLQGP